MNAVLPNQPFIHVMSFHGRGYLFSYYPVAANFPIHEVSSSTNLLSRMSWHIVEKLGIVISLYV